MQLKIIIEPHMVHRMRPAMDAQDKRIFLVRIESWRLYDPALDPGPVFGVVPDLFHLPEFDIGEDIFIHIGQAPDPIGCV